MTHAEFVLQVLAWPPFCAGGSESSARQKALWDARRACGVFLWGSQVSRMTPQTRVLSAQGPRAGAYFSGRHVCGMHARLQMSEHREVVR